MKTGKEIVPRMGIIALTTSLLVFNPNPLKAKMEVYTPLKVVEPLNSTAYQTKTLDPVVAELSLNTSAIIESTLISTESLTDTKENPLLSYDLSSPNTFELTAYTLAPEENGYWGTISSAQYELEGKYLPDRYIAIDPTVVPYHTKIYIEFPEEKRYINFHGETIDLNGEYLAVDCGSAIQGKRIDLFVGGNGTYYDNVANHIGRGDVTVYRPIGGAE